MDFLGVLFLFRLFFLEKSAIVYYGNVTFFLEVTGRRAEEIRKFYYFSAKFLGVSSWEYSTNTNNTHWKYLSMLTKTLN
jgi:hypothetical protein